uniref:Uncharacterized protein n=1 Tax=Cannabis sativa TaxID=3483 RepID=A0A803PQZ5_CANSA
MSSTKDTRGSLAFKSRSSGKSSAGAISVVPDLKSKHGVARTDREKWSLKCGDDGGLKRNEEDEQEKRIARFMKKKTKGERKARSTMEV